MQQATLYPTATTDCNITGEYQRASKHSQGATRATPLHKYRADKFDFSTQEKWIVLKCDLSAVTMDNDSNRNVPTALAGNICMGGYLQPNLESWKVVGV